METRKLIKFGKSSFVISLPKNWINKYNLKKGDFLFLDFDENNIILSSDKHKIEKKHKKKTIDAENKDFQIIQREITNAYINGYNEITVKSHDSLLLKNTRDLFHSFVALEVLEQTKDTLIAKDFLNMEEISLKNCIRKMDIITRSMFIDTKTDSPKKMIQSLYDRDHDIDRLNFLIMRGVYSALNDSSLASHYKKNNVELINFLFISQSLEKIGDVLKRISKLKIKNKKNLKMFKDLKEDINGFYLKTMKAFYNQDLNIVYNIVSKKKQYLKDFKNFNYVGNSKAKANYVQNLKILVVTIHEIGRFLSNILIS